QTVDCEVSSQDVLLGVRENHAGGMPAVDVGFIGTKRCDFERMPPLDHHYDAKLGANSFGPRKNPDHLFRKRTCGNIVISRLDLHDHVAHTAPDEIRFMPMTA